ncbi:hypothetical protein JTE90_016337 [Oedothorax gibbosus]|uniref:Uncharacterized protein n=1 Tax=Oedothorax gibbosus TaxID=931172 RepID=A0AAV6TQQ5_9ARAC|nr:hypothetical protein JTE90_016337 [Oedothorax gibbosus]
MSAVSNSTQCQVISRLKPDGFATVALDDVQCAVVMDTHWFCQSIHEQNWEQKVMDTLKEFRVANVYIPYGTLPLKKAADDGMNVIMAEKPFYLKYNCNQCTRERQCAVTKAYLNWRQIAKRQPCTLTHL